MTPDDLPAWLAARIDTAKRAHLHALLEQRGVPRSPSTITAWLKGRGVPEPECLPSIVDALGLDAEQASDLYALCGVPLHSVLFTSSEAAAS